MSHCVAPNLLAEAQSVLRVHYSKSEWSGYCGDCNVEYPCDAAELAKVIVAVVKALSNGTQPEHIDAILEGL